MYEQKYIKTFVVDGTLDWYDSLSAIVTSFRL